MPPKRQKVMSSKLPTRRKASSSSEQPLSNTFISLAAQSRYTNSLVRRKCIPERGIVDPFHSVGRLIELMKWEDFVKQPESVVVPVVREFYANAPEHRDKRVWVRGMWVPFDSETINRYYNLPEVDDEEYVELQFDATVYDEVLKVLSYEGTDWVRSKNEIRNIPRAGLSKPSKVWHYFISAKLMPSMHVAGCSKERALLNYAIQKQVPINVGNIIEASILSFARLTTSTGGFGHSSLIYALCLQAGVVARPAEEILQPQLAISPDLVKTFKGPPSSSGAGTSSAPASSSRQRPQRTAEAASDTTSDRLDQLTRRIDVMVKRHDMQYAHLLQCFAVSVASSSGTSTVLPPAPRFPSYPAVDEVESDDSEEDTSRSGESGDEDGSEDGNSADEEVAEAAD